MASEDGREDQEKSRPLQGSARSSPDELLHLRVGPLADMGVADDALLVDDHRRRPVPSCA